MSGRAPCKSASKDDLLAVVKKHITNPSSVPPYAESGTAGLEVKKITVLAKMWQELHTSFGGLSFKKTLFQEALSDLDFGMGDDQKKWVTVTYNRLNKMMRHISQAMQRKTPPSWVVQMMNIDAPPEAEVEGDEEDHDSDGHDGGESQDGDGGAGEGAAGAGEVEAATEYVYGWDTDSLQAFRAPFATPNEKEYTDDVNVSSDDPKGFVIAKFFDDVIAVIVDITNEEFEVNTAIRFQKKKGTL